MLLNILLLIAGFVLLIKGADYFVDGSSALANRMHIPPIIIGLTIVEMQRRIDLLGEFLRYTLYHRVYRPLYRGQTQLQSEMYWGRIS